VTQFRTFIANKQASGTKKITFQNETYLKQIATHAASEGRSRLYGLIMQINK